MIDESKDTPYEMLRAMEQTHVCAGCGGNLVTVWNEAKAVSQLVCSKDHEHVGVKRRQSDTELLKRGELDTKHRAGTQASLERSATQGAGMYSLAPTKDVATGAAITVQQLGGLVGFANSIGLNLLLGHVCLYFGQPYITIDGYYYLKNARGERFAVCATPMTPAERKSYLITEGSHAFIARALTASGDELGRGIGIITPEEMNEKSERHPEHFAAPIVHDKPQRMAEKRAEWQLLKKMVPLGADIVGSSPTPGESKPKVVVSDEDIKNLWE